MIINVTETMARHIMRKYGFPVFLWCTARAENAKYQAVVCDYTQLAGYTVKYAVAIYTKAGKLIERFNIQH